MHAVPVRAQRDATMTHSAQPWMHSARRRRRLVSAAVAIVIAVCASTARAQESDGFVRVGEAPVPGTSDAARGPAPARVPPVEMPVNRGVAALPGVFTAAIGYGATLAAMATQASAGGRGCNRMLFALVPVVGGMISSGSDGCMPLGAGALSLVSQVGGLAMLLAAVLADSVVPVSSESNAAGSRAVRRPDLFLVMGGIALHLAGYLPALAYSVEAGSRTTQPWNSLGVIPFVGPLLTTLSLPAGSPLAPLYWIGAVLLPTAQVAGIALIVSGSAGRVGVRPADLSRAAGARAVARTDALAVAPFIDASPERAILGAAARF